MNIEITYPEFIWDEFFWVTTAILPSWNGFHLPGQILRDEKDGERAKAHKIIFAPEGRDDAPLNTDEINLVQWFIEHEEPIHDAMLNVLNEEYPSIRDEFSEYLGDEAEDCLPEINNPTELKNLVAIESINIHPIFDEGVPFIGVNLSCSWDDEHGVGVLLHGTDALEVGGGDIASTLWAVKKHVS